MKTKFFFRTFATALIFSLALFVSAGSIDYYQGWIFLIVNIITCLLNFWTIKDYPELITERLHPGEGTKSWDKLILGIAAFVYLINVIVAGLDSGRFQWSPTFHWSLYTLGTMLMLLGQVIFLIARKENKYFSSIIRIQSDRNHSVCDTGIYKLVRHPGYLGVTISLLGFPLITGSLWSILPTIVASLLLFIRTYLEDKTLKTELLGYVEYTKRTRYLLIPKLW